MTPQEHAAVEKAIATLKAAARAGEGDPIPEGFDTWTHEQVVAYTKAMFALDAEYTPTAEELEAARHMLAKMESASGMNQRDPNAD